MSNQFLFASLESGRNKTRKRMERNKIIEKDEEKKEENKPKKSKKSESKEEQSPVTWWSLFDRGLSVIISLISTAVYSIIVSRSNRIELTIIIIVAFLLWLSIDGVLRSWIGRMWSLKYNKGWQSVLLDVVNFVSLLGIFLVLELILGNLVNNINSSNPSLFEIGVAIYSVMLIGFSLVHTIKILMT
jgi:hypothetical protein